MSKINLQRGKLTVENRKSRERKRICSEVSVNSPGNPWSRIKGHKTADYRDKIRPQLLTEALPFSPLDLLLLHAVKIYQIHHWPDSTFYIDRGSTFLFMEIRRLM